MFSRVLVAASSLLFVLLLRLSLITLGGTDCQEWSYDDALTNGPSSWGTLYDPRDPLVFAYPSCDSGSQSPVDIRGRSSGVVNIAVDGSVSAAAAASAASTFLPPVAQSSGGNYATLNSALKELPLRWSGMTNMSFSVGGNGGGKVLSLSPAEGSSGAPFADPNTGKGYVFTHADIHTPAEHWISGVRPDAEIQLFHEARATTGSAFDSSTYSTLVVSILLEAVSSFSTHEDIRRLVADLQSLFGERGTSSIAETAQYNVSANGGGTVSLSSFLPTSSDYFTYDGSLSYPPCTQGVKWYVLAESVKVSTGQLDLLRTAVGLQSLSSVELSQSFSSSSSSSLSAGTESLVDMDGNSRPPQSLGTRPLWYFKSGGGSSSEATVSGSGCGEGDTDSPLICADQDRKGTSVTALVFAILAIVSCVAALALRLSEHGPHNRR